MTFTRTGRRRPAEMWPDWLASKLYVSGISSGGCYTRTEDGRPIRTVYFRGKRPYKFFISRDQWRCLLSRSPHWPKMLNHGGDFGMCGICYPCPECGSQTDDRFPACEWYYPPVPTYAPADDFTIKPFDAYISERHS